MKTVEAGNAPTTVAAVPGADEVVVLNVLSNDATVLRTDGTTLTSRTIPGIVAGANRLVVSPHGRFAIAWVDGRQVANARATDGFQTLTVLDLGATDPAAAHTTLAVGFRPVSVSFSSDERRAFAVTEDGVSILTLDGAGGPRSATTSRSTPIRRRPPTRATSRSPRTGASRSCGARAATAWAWSTSAAAR